MMKKICQLLSAALAVLMFCNTPAFAESLEDLLKNRVDINTDQGLQKAVQTVKARIDIPANYTEFTSSLESDRTAAADGRVSWRLTWSSKASYMDRNGGSIGVTIDNRWNILSYDHYRYSGDDGDGRRLPGLTKAMALEAAKKGIYYLCPDIADQIAVDSEKSLETYQSDGSYSFYFFRQVNHIPFYQNGVTLMIDGNSGEVTGFNRQWDDSIIFPEAGPAISMEAAQKSYREKVGLELRYRKDENANIKSTYLEYSVPDQETNSAINALTGEKVDVGTQHNPIYDAIYNADYRNTMYGRDLERESDTLLTNDEMDNIKQTETDLKTVEELEKAAREMVWLGLDDTWRMESCGYSRNGDNGGRYVIRMTFVQQLSKEDMPGDIPEEKLKVMEAAGEFNRRATVFLDAKTAEIVAFQNYNPGGRNTQEIKYQRDEQRKIAEGFLNSCKQEKFTQTQFTGAEGQYNNDKEKYGIWNPDGENSLVFTRKVNGIFYKENSLVVNVDPVAGKITYFGEVWEDTDFAPAGEVINVEKAYEILFHQIGLELEYVADNGSQQAGEAFLVYMPDSSRPTYIDASNGNRIGYFSRKPYKQTASSYTDVAGHPLENKIMALWNAGFLPEEENFRPDEPILQREFLFMASKALGKYNMGDAGDPDEFTQKRWDGFYRMLINDRMLTEQERDPDHRITHEEAVKYFLKLLGYEKFASLEGIFNCTYSDKDQIAPELIGYATIAGALKILGPQDSQFMPKEELTRAEAAEWVYNYLKK